MSEQDRTAPSAATARLGIRPDGSYTRSKKPVVLYSQYIASKKAPDSKSLEQPDPSAEKRDYFETADEQTAEHRTRIPLIDLLSVMRIGWSYRGMMLCLVAAGMLGGSGFAITIPSKYSAISTLYFDPTSIRTSQEGRDVSVQSEVMKATIDSQTKIIALDSVVWPVVMKLRLTRDLPSAGGTVEDVVGSLKKAIKITRADDTYITEVQVTTGSPTQSAKIANALVETFLNQEKQRKLDKYATINSAFQGRLDELRKQVEQSESAVEQFRSENDLIEAEGDLISDKRLTALNDLLVTTQQATIAAKSKLDSATRINVNDVVNGTLKDTVASSTLSSLRVQYANLASSLGRLESQMGSRHPSLIAAKASMETLKSELRNELSRMVSSAKDEYDQASKTEKSLQSELAAQKSLQSTISPEMVQLKELERKATADKEIYEAVLKRAGETTEEKNLLQNNIRVVSEATPPIAADAPGRAMLLIAGLFGGLMFGLGIGLMAALFRNAFDGGPIYRSRSYLSRG
ncbi:GumC family protein [Rhizobium sp. KVB221]|uniref:GumC family protein n=1 Tax=Rhizobium setariae TaxID=2801340 RepID=A0A936YN02_9HYPH|nr:GumC family protein [Rhizobium setariae]MBL0373514.1 GumC family protein [Rhizobium setariae]